MRAEVREATDQDVEALLRMFVEAHQPHLEAMPHVFKGMDDIASIRGFLLDLIERADSGVFVAELDGNPVGCLWMTEQQTPEWTILVPRRYAMIGNVVVGAQVRRRGIGRALLDQAHRWATDRGIDEVELNVYEFNTGAIALYERLGYATVSRRMWRSLR